MVEGSGVEPLTGKVPGASGGTNRPPYKTGPGGGQVLNSKPSPFGWTRSHDGGGRGNIGYNPRHPDPVVNIASSASGNQGRAAATARPLFRLTQNCQQNLFSPPNARIVQPIFTAFLEPGRGDQRRVCVDNPVKALCLDTGLASRLHQTSRPKYRAPSEGSGDRKSAPGGRLPHWSWFWATP